jgi:chromate reductase
VEIPIKDLPVYNRDFDNDYPAVAREFTLDALLFVTPEYNRGVPGKNAIDWASRPFGTNTSLAQ